MYTWEINNYLIERNFILNYDEFIFITDVNKNTQIKKIKYYSNDNNYSIETFDGGFWKFKVYKKEKILRRK